MKGFNFLNTIIIPYLVFVDKVECLNSENLMGNNPLYGMASIAYGNFSMCFKQLREFKDAVDAEKVWGLKVLDASGRAPAGFIYGNNLWIGSHSQCLDIQNRKNFEIRVEKVDHLVTTFDYPPFEFGFAMVMMHHNSTLQYHMRLPLDNVIQLGLCIPKSCSNQELFQLSKEYFSNNSLEFQNNYNVDLNVTEIRMLKEDFLWMLYLPKTIVCLVVVTSILLLTVIGTICDVKEHNREKNLIRGHNNGVLNGKVVSKGGLPSVEMISNEALIEIQKSSIIMEILKCFSFYSNAKRWTKTKISSDSLSVIHGLRFLSMLWVIIVHTSFFQGDFVKNPPFAFRITETFVAQIISNSTYSVDTYLFLSGFLLAYLYFKKFNTHEAINRPVSLISSVGKFFYMYLSRYLRLTPTYLIVIMLCNQVYTYYNQQSSLYFSERPDMVCDKYWWRNILYINNLYPRSEMCLSWSWYLSVDMQFFTIGSFLLLLSTAYFKVAAALSLLMILIQVIVTTYKSYSIGYIPTLDDQLAQLDAIYDLPWNRIGPYIVGIITAYILVIRLQHKLVLKERTRLTFWVIFPMINLWVLFTLYTRQISVEYSAIYMGVSRTLWGVGIGWFVVAVSTGNARLLEKFMSYKAWIPLGRLTYCAYLLNPLVVTMIALGSESGIVMTTPESAMSASGTIMMTMMLSFLFSLLFESPFILATKLLFRSATSKPSNNICSQEKVDAADNQSSGSGSSSNLSTIA